MFEPFAGAELSSAGARLILECVPLRPAALVYTTEVRFAWLEAAVGQRTCNDVAVGMPGRAVVGWLRDGGVAREIEDRLPTLGK